MRDCNLYTLIVPAILQASSDYRVGAVLVSRNDPRDFSYVYSMTSPIEMASDKIRVQRTENMVTVV